jgi:hypothetical protein
MIFTHILVDFENTQPSAADVALLVGKDHRLWIFRGPGQKKYEAEFAEALLALGERVRMVKCEKPGRNAVDMHIAFQIGRLLGELTEDQAAPLTVAFMLVSGDADYDPLLHYVRALGHAARRVASLGEALGAAPLAKGRPTATKARTVKKIPAPKPVRTATKVAGAKGLPRGAACSPPTAAGPSIEELVEKVMDQLRDHPKNRPARRDRLKSWLVSHLRSKLAIGEVPAIVTALEKRGVVRFEGNKIEYPRWS